jgi:hypothetical protein
MYHKLPKEHESIPISKLFECNKDDVIATGFGYNNNTNEQLPVIKNKLIDFYLEKLRQHLNLAKDCPPETLYQLAKQTTLKWTLAEKLVIKQLQTKRLKPDYHINNTNIWVDIKRRWSYSVEKTGCYQFDSWCECIEYIMQGNDVYFLEYYENVYPIKNLLTQNLKTKVK